MYVYIEIWTLEIGLKVKIRLARLVQSMAMSSSGLLKAVNEYDVR